MSFSLLPRSWPQASAPSDGKSRGRSAEHRAGAGGPRLRPRRRGLLWAYPLAITAATAEIAINTDKPLPNGHAPFNSFGHVGKFISAADKDVVSSNADTIYSSAFLDLKQGAALISVPDTGGRYYSLMLEDAYTNVFGYIGSRATGSGPGQYLIAGPGWTGATPADAKRIDAPTPLVWVIGRTLIDGEKDMPNVAAIQRQYTLAMVPPVLDPKP